MRCLPMSQQRQAGKVPGLVYLMDSSGPRKTNPGDPGDVGDSTGRNPAGLRTGAVSWLMTPLGWGLNFTASNAVVDLGKPFLAPKGFTLLFGAYAPSNSTEQNLLYYGQGYNYPGFYLSIYQTHLYLTAGTNGLPCSTFTPGYHACAMSYDGHVATLWMDGVVASSTMSIATPVGDFCLGGPLPLNGPGALTGWIAGLALFNRGLSTNEISAYFADPSAYLLTRSKV